MDNRVDKAVEGIEAVDNKDQGGTAGRVGVDMGGNLALHRFQYLRLCSHPKNHHLPETN